MQRTDDSGQMTQSEQDTTLRKEAVAWVIRLQNERISPEDRRAFEAWLGQNPAHAQMYGKVSTVWDSPELSAAAASSRLHLFNAKPVVSRRWPIWVAVCVGLAAISLIQLDLATRWQADYRTEVGERRTVELPDRSIATLNTQSAIALSFDDVARRVRLLKGEAFFHVQQDAARPFLVESAESAVRAVGTAFVVRTDPDGDRITVLEGTVEVQSKAKTDTPVTMTARSQLQAEPQHLGRPQAVEIATASSWMRGRLVVQNVPFSQVLYELQRYHGGRIFLMNRQVGHINVTGTYNVDDPVGALALLLQTVPLSTISLADRLVILF
ncbi:MAG: FecR domain-containing protein [Nitrospira sp.]